MMDKITACIICSKREEFIGLTLESIAFVDEVIIVGDPDEFTINIINNSIIKDKIRIYYRTWDNRYGAARRKAVELATNPWILQIDADEVLGDEGWRLTEYIDKIDVLDLQYKHFIYNAGLLDNTQQIHIGINRFFRKKGVTYKREVHEFAESRDWKNKAFAPEIVLWHLGYLKGIGKVLEKYWMNMMRPDKVHDVNFLKQWIYWHTSGTYPVRQITKEEIEEMPMFLKRFFSWL